MQVLNRKQKCIHINKILHLSLSGASSGIGAATAVEFARAGASVALIARSVEGLQSTAQKCQQAGAEKDKVKITLKQLRQ